MTSLCLCLVLAVVGPARPAGQQVLDRVLALVAGQVITLSDVRATIDLGFVDVAGAENPIATALDRLVERSLILAEVDRYALPRPDPAEVSQRVARIKERFRTDGEFAAVLAAGAMTAARLRQTITDDLRIEAYLDERFEAATQPTEDEIAEYYRARPDVFSRNGTVLPLSEVREDARALLAAERRRTLIAGWVADLKRRGNVTIFARPEI